jgi:hypothetical protein
MELNCHVLRSPRHQNIWHPCCLLPWPWLPHDSWKLDNCLIWGVWRNNDHWCEALWIPTILWHKDANEVSKRWFILPQNFLYFLLKLYNHLPPTCFCLLNYVGIHTIEFKSTIYQNSSIESIIQQKNQIYVTIQNPDLRIRMSRSFYNWQNDCKFEEKLVKASKTETHLISFHPCNFHSRTSINMPPSVAEELEEVQEDDKHHLPPP